MKKFIKLFSLLVVLGLIAWVPSQAQTVTVNVSIVDFGIGQIYTDGSGTLTATGGNAQVTFPNHGCLNLAAEVVGSGGGTGSGKVKLNHKGHVIEVAPQAVQAHLNHGDTIVPEGSTATASLNNNGDGTSTLFVSGVTADVTVNVTGSITF